MQLSLRSQIAPPSPKYKINRTKGIMLSVKNELIKFNIINGKYPTKEKGLKVLENYDIDAWGNQLGYNVKGKNVILFSLGNDNAIGGEGYDKDIFLKW